MGYEVQLLQSDNLTGEEPAQPNVTPAANDWDAIAALEAAAKGVPIDHELWMRKEKIRALEGTL